MLITTKLITTIYFKVLLKKYFIICITNFKDQNKPVSFNY